MISSSNDNDFWNDCGDSNIHPITIASKQKNKTYPKYFNIKPINQSLISAKQFQPELLRNKSDQKQNTLSQPTSKSKTKTYLISRNAQIKNSTLKNIIPTSTKKHNEELQECTFQPKISKINHKAIQATINEYARIPIYNRCQIYKIKVKESALRNTIDLREIYKSKFKFHPNIDKKSDMSRVFRNGINNNENKNYYNFCQRYSNARIKRKASCESGRGSYTSRSLVDGEGNPGKDTNRDYSNESSVLKRRSISQRETEEYMQTLHSELMTMKWDDDY